MSTEQSEIRIYAQGSIPEFQFDDDPLDRIYLPVRAVAFLYSDPNALLVLPDASGVRTYINQFKQICANLGLDQISRNNPVFVPDDHYLMDVNIGNNLPLLNERLTAGNRYRVYPYATTPELENWINEIRSEGHDIHTTSPRKTYHENPLSIDHRGGWSRWISNPNQPSFPERYGLPYPRSFVGQGLDETLRAYDLVTAQTGDSRAVFKPVFSAGGSTLGFINSREEVEDHYYKLSQMGALEVMKQESPIEIQEFIEDLDRNYCIHYDGEKINTPSVVSWQVIKNNMWAGNRFNFSEDPQIINEAERNFRQFSKAYRQEMGYPLVGWGGVDMSRRVSGELVFIEHNGQRINGGHPAIAMAEGLGFVDQPFVTQKAPAGREDVDLLTIWGELDGLRYNPERRQGIMPMVWTEGSRILLATSSSYVEAERMLSDAYSALLRRDLAKG